VNNRWNAASRLMPCSTLAWLALACGGIQTPTETNAPLPDVARDTCEDNQLLAGCSPSPAPTAEVADPAQPGDSVTDTTSELELARAAAQNVLRVNCGQCHGPQLTTQAARAGMNYIDDIDTLVNEGKLVPLASEQSPVVRRMQEGSMPPLNNDGPRPSSRDIDVVAQFVDNPLFWPEYRPASTCDGQLFTFDQLYTAVQKDLRDQDGDVREFMRYVTLTNRYNAGLCAETLDRERFALVKVVNMLSTRPRITAPVAIDDDRLIYRIDIRDYNWDRDIDVRGAQFRDGWEAIIATSPYAVPFVGDQADDIRDDTLTDVPVMNADALLAAASIGDLYYGLIDVDVRQPLGNFISNDLGIDVQDDIDQANTIRAGTTRSAISREDRVVERHDIGVRGGAFWQSFDDAGNEAGESIFSDPFGFNEGGTDAIFSLPNGMLGFIIADDNDNIVSETNLLLDTFQDDFIARTSVSCSNCHAQGFNPVTDEVRPFVLSNRFSFKRDDLEAVRDIYLEPADFTRVIDEDSAIFQQSLQQAGLPITGADPVSANFVRFNNVELDLNTAAGELGVTAEDLRTNLTLLDPSLGALRFITVERSQFTAVYEQSLCVMQLISKNQPDPDRCDQLLGN
jgi:mono/diheme cytochrome c family protein